VCETILTEPTTAIPEIGLEGGESFLDSDLFSFEVSIILAHSFLFKALTGVAFGGGYSSGNLLDY
jgi:hypothetical protein